ncbi:MAG TPA: ribbon-helix-helix domain-containing protein [Thermoplasmata archaeon]|nr:ribbon-helix-helix domain-containing protein [Thermoplasmata archaeon]
MGRTLVGRTRSFRPTRAPRCSMPVETEKITLRLPARFLKALDFLVEVDDFPSRSEAVRAAIRDFVYARVELVTDKLRKMEDAERSMAQMEAFRRDFMQK